MPLATSPLADRGVALSGVNDGYAGAAPDIGAVEYADLIFAKSIAASAAHNGVVLLWERRKPRCFWLQPEISTLRPRKFCPTRSTGSVGAPEGAMLYF